MGDNTSIEPASSKLNHNKNAHQMSDQVVEDYSNGQMNDDQSISEKAIANQVKKDENCLADNETNHVKQHNDELSDEDEQKSSDQLSTSSAEQSKKDENEDEANNRNETTQTDEEIVDTNVETSVITETAASNDTDHTASSVTDNSTNAKQTNLSNSYTDFGGVNLEEFLFSLLQNNFRNRLNLLKIEQELINFVKDETRSTYQFPAMSSYLRMLVHRVAAYFGLEHNIDANGRSVIVTKQDGLTRIPELRFKDQIKQMSAEEPKKLILKRNTNALEDVGGRGDSRSSNNGLDARRTRSFEERNEHYEKVKARIFNQTSTYQPKSVALDSQLSHIDETDQKCNSTEPNALVSNSNSNNHLNHQQQHHHPQAQPSHSTQRPTNFDSGQQSFYSPYGYANNYHHQHHAHDDHQQSTSKLLSDGSSKNQFYKNNGFKGHKSNNKIHLKNNKQQQHGHPVPPQAFYQPHNLPSHHQMINTLDQQHLYSNWLQAPTDLNAQQQPLYQHLSAYNPMAHANQQKMFLLCNYPETHSYSNDKMVPSPVVGLTSTNANSMNHVPVNGQPLPQASSSSSVAHNSVKEKENQNSYVAQMSNMSLGSMNPDQINDGVQNRASTGIPICYLESPPYYPVAAGSNEMMFQSGLAQRAHLQTNQMVLLNHNFNSPLNNPNYNRPNSILSAPQQPQSIGAIVNGHQRFTNAPNYSSFALNGSTSHLEMNQMYAHMPSYLMPNMIRPQQSPLLPTPLTGVVPSKTTTSLKQVSKKKLNDNQADHQQMNGFMKTERKKMNGNCEPKNVDYRKSSSSPSTVSSMAMSSTKPKTSSVKSVSSTSTIASNGSTTRISSPLESNGV